MLWVVVGIANGYLLMAPLANIGGRQQWPLMHTTPRYAIGLDNRLLLKYAQWSIVGVDGHRWTQVHVYYRREYLSVDRTLFGPLFKHVYRGCFPDTYGAGQWPSADNHHTPL